MTSFDLHTHSTASDGTLPPAQLVEQAASAGIAVLALTDHDTLSGIAEAQRAAAAHGITLWPGVEVSVTWKRLTVHIVGLRVDPENRALNQGLAGLQEFRQWRALEIGRRLEQKGIVGAFAGAQALANSALISRTHFARFLHQHGYAKEERKVYQHYLTHGKPGYVAGEWATLDDALSWIHAAGGQAVVAHPARYRMTRTKLKQLLKEFATLGGAGIEVVSGSHGPQESATLAQLAGEFGLAGSIGSDYHGPEGSWLELGHLPPLPSGVRPIWQPVE